MTKSRTGFYGEILCDECGQPCTTKPNYQMNIDPQPILHECEPEGIMQEAIRKIVARGISARWTADQITKAIIKAGHCNALKD